MYRKIVSKLPYPTRENWVWWALIAMIVAIVVLGGVFLTRVALRASGLWPDDVAPTATRAPVPQIALSPAQGRPGETITVTGSSWPVGEVIALRLVAPAGNETAAIDLVTTTVGIEGTFSESLSVPVIRPWSQFQVVRIQAVGRASATTVTAVFDLVAAPTPAPGTTSSPETPTLTPVPSATPVAPTPTATPTAAPIVTPTPEAAVWRGEYFNNITLTGNPSVVREDAAVSFDWGSSQPVFGILADGFSVRWSRTVTFSAGTYRFYATADDGVRVWLDGQLMIDEWHGARPVVYTADRTLLAGEHRLVVEYYEVAADASVRVWWDRPGLYPQWRGEYYDTPDLAGVPLLTRNDVAIDFDWGAASPAAGVPADKFSIRWTRTLSFDAGTYRFRVLVDDGVRLTIDGKQVIDAWTNGSAREVTGQVTLASGDHALRLEYYDAGGDAVVELTWERADSYPDWKGEYWRNRSLTGLPLVVRNDARVDFDWQAGSPASEIPSDNFSAQWTRTVAFSPGTYVFTVRMDDGARLWVDDRLVIDAWQDGALRQVSATLPLAAGEHTLRLAYYESVGQARVSLNWEETAITFQEWKGEYWPNRTLTGNPSLVRNDSKIAFDWGQGSPATGLPADDFAARWSRTLTLEAGVYRFNAVADDGVRVRVDGDLVIDEWHTSAGNTVYSSDLSLAQGEHTIIVEYYEGTIDASIEVWIERVGELTTPSPTPTATPGATDTPTPTPGTPTATLTPSVTPTPTETPSPTVTPTPTETPTPTITPTPTLAPITDTVRINEIMAVVDATDWNKDGDIDDGDAWVELYNPTDRIFDLSWWVLDVQGVGKYGYTLPVATTLKPDAYLVIFSDETDFALTEGVLRLRQGAIAYDEVPLREMPADLSMSRDAWGYWQSEWLPTPGSLNLPPVASGRAR